MPPLNAYLTAYNQWADLCRQWGWRDNSRNTYATIRESMLKDLRYRVNRPEFASVVREIRGHLVLLGKLRAAGVAR
jgi:hypothetical protein